MVGGLGLKGGLTRDAVALDGGKVVDLYAGSHESDCSPLLVQ